MEEFVIEVHGLSNCVAGHWIHRDLDFQVKRGEIVGLIGGSGAGKTTLLRSLLLLQPIQGGQLKLFNQEVSMAREAFSNAVRQRLGVLFQQSALFSSLTVLENIAFPLKEFSQLASHWRYQLASLKLLMAGLTMDSAAKYPAELSGGMLKRAALARALVMDPELLFLDEPTAGLDPKSARLFDQLIHTLSKTLGLTIVMISHDLTSLERVTDRVAFLGEQRILAMLPYQQLVQQNHPLIEDYFRG